MKYLLLTFYLLLCWTVSSQTDSTLHTVTGTVFDEHKEPLIGCYVSIERSSTRGTLCDIDGNYSIQVRMNEVLVYSFVGHKKIEREYKGEERIDIVLEEDCPQLSGDHPVYSHRQRLHDTSVLLRKNDYSSDPQQDIQRGLVSGLSLHPGKSVFEPLPGIRSGTGNIGGETKYVVNGIEDAPFHAADILNFRVIGDAASAAVYGSATSPGGIIRIETAYPNYPARYLTAESRTGISQAAILLPHNNKDLYKPGLRTALTQHYHIKFSTYKPIGKTTLYVSGLASYDDREGVIKDSDARRFSSRMTGGLHRRRFDLSQTIYFDRQEQDLRWLYRGDMATPTTEGKTDRGRQQSNPRHEFFSASTLRFTPWDWLNIQSSFSYDRINNRGGSAEENQYPTSYRDYYDFRRQENARTRRWSWNNTVEATFYDGWGAWIFDAAFNREMTSLVPGSSTPSHERSRAINNILVSGQYNTGMGKYAASASIRKLSSPLLSKEEVYLPSVTAAWRFLTQRNDCYRTSKYSEGKLKAGWSKTAHTGLMLPVAAGDGYAYPAFSASGLRWQVTEQANAGLYFAFLHHNLQFSAVYYYKETDHLLEYTFSPSQVMQLSSGDAGIVNQGVEFNTSYEVRLFDLWWDFTGNFSYNHSSVIHAPADAHLVLGTFIAPEYTCGAGIKTKLMGTDLSLGMYFEGNIHQKTTSHAFAQPYRQHHADVSYFALKSLDASYNFYNLFHKKVDLTLFMNADNLLAFANSSLKNPEHSDFSRQFVNRTVSLGMKVYLR